VFDDGGGKKKAMTFELAEKKSPLKKEAGVVRTKCADDEHWWKEEPDKKCARKGTGWTLADVCCDGLDDAPCGAEFVEHLSDARDPEKAMIVSLAKPALWCRLCKLVMCHPCHQKWIMRPKCSRKRCKVSKALFEE
jgi:hypothetical protein